MDNKQARPLMLSTQQLVMAYWSQVEPLLASAPIAEELSTTEILQGVITGQYIIFVVAPEVDATPMTGAEVELVLLLSRPTSETFPVITILTVAGKDLKKNATEFWEFFKGWCFIIGARAIDAYVPERMVDYLEQKLGLKKETVHVRLRL